MSIIDKRWLAWIKKHRTYWCFGLPAKRLHILFVVLLILLEVLLGIVFSENVKAFLSTINIWGINNLELFNSLSTSLLPCGIGLLINYLVVAIVYNVISFVLYTLQKILFFLFTKRGVKKYARDLIGWSINSLCTPDVKWGAYSIPNLNQPETANCCEGLLALYFAHKHKEYHIIFNNVLSVLTNELTTHGLKSKTMPGCETVVPTSMYLFLRSKLCKDNNQQLSQIEENILKHLWSIRNKSYGWGRYIQTTENEECCVCNTFWAIWALAQVPQYRNDQDFLHFVNQLYPESTSCFSFSTSLDQQPQICTTAMMLLLYFDLPRDLQKNIEKNIKNITLLMPLYTY